MTANDKVQLIYATFPTTEAARSAGTQLVDSGLAACVNIIPGMTSIYRWQGERHQDSEVVMIIKTRAGAAERAIERVRASHPYTNPALLLLPVVGGSAEYLDWVLAQTSGMQTD